MDREFSYFSRFVRGLYDACPDTALSETVFQESLSLLRQETRALQQRVICRMGSFTGDKKARSYIGQCLSGLVALINMLTVYPDREYSETEADCSNRQLAASACKLLEDLLADIQSCFFHYCDQDLRAPDVQANAFARERRRQAALLRKKLLKTGVCPELALMITEAIGCYPDSGCPITFRHIQYYQIVTDALHGIPDEHPEMPDRRLREVLFYFNFNHPGFVRHCITLLASAVAAADTMDQKIVLLRRMLKENNQASVMPDVAFASKSRPIQTQIGLWLSEELWYADGAEFSRKGCQRSTEEPEVSIQTGLSVAQLACLIRLLTTGGVITHDNHSELFRWISGSFLSHKNGRFSEGSFRSKFYAVDRGTAHAVRDMLLRLVQASRKVIY